MHLVPPLAQSNCADKYYDPYALDTPCYAMHCFRTRARNCDVVARTAANAVHSASAPQYPDAASSRRGKNHMLKECNKRCDLNAAPCLGHQQKRDLAERGPQSTPLQMLTPTKSVCHNKTVNRCVCLRTRHLCVMLRSCATCVKRQAVSATARQPLN